MMSVATKHGTGPVADTWGMTDQMATHERLRGCACCVPMAVSLASVCASGAGGLSLHCRVCRVFEQGECSPSVECLLY
jgi:hypothetical protein